MTHRVASLVMAAVPRLRAAAAQPASSCRRQSWLRHDVDTSVSERTRSGWFSARIWAIAPPIEAPTMWASVAPTASSTATASSAIWSNV